MANVATLTAKMVMDVSGFSSGASKAIGYVNQLKGGIGSLSASMAAGAAGGLAMAGAMATLNAGLSAVTSVANAAKDALMWGAELAADQEQAQVAFTTMLKSGTAATEMLQKLEKFATATPFDFPQVRNSAKSLLAMGVASKDIQPSLQTLGEIASGVGVPLEQLSMVFGQVKTAGRLMTQDMNQFTSAGIALPKALAKELGIADTEVRKFVESGKVSFKTFQNALIGLAESDFAGGMEKQSRTALGAMSTLKDQAGGLFKDLATGIGEQFKTTEWINDLAGFLGYVREKWGPALIGAFTALTNTLDTALTPLRIGLAHLMRSMATLESLRGSIFKGTVSEDTLGAGGAENAAMLNMGANAISGNTIGQSASKLQAFFKANSIAPEGAAGLKTSRIADLGKSIGSGVMGGIVGGLMGAGANIGNMAVGGAKSLVRSVLTPDAQQEQKSTGALAVGSSEAFSAIIRAMTGRDQNKPAERTAKAAEAAEKLLGEAVKFLGKLADDAGGVVNAFSG